MIQDSHQNPFQTPPRVHGNGEVGAKPQIGNGFGWLIGAIGVFLALGLFLIFLFPELCKKIEAENAVFPRQVRIVLDCVRWVSANFWYLLASLLLLFLTNELISMEREKVRFRKLGGQLLCTLLVACAIWIGWVIAASL